jgi:hypothetical protein
MARQRAYWISLVAILLMLGLARNASAEELVGTIVRVDGQRMTFVMADERGATKTIQMDEDAQVFINDQEVVLDDLVSGDVVRVLARQQEDQWLAIAVYCTR